MPPIQGLATAAAPTIRRAVPLVTELFRGGTLHPPAPAAEVARHIASRREASLNSRAKTPFSSYYSPNSASNNNNSLPNNSSTINNLGNSNIGNYNNNPTSSSISSSSSYCCNDSNSSLGPLSAASSSSTATPSRTIISSPYDVSSSAKLGIGGAGVSGGLAAGLPQVNNCRDLCSHSSKGQPMLDYNTYSMEEEVSRRQRRLTVLFTWLGAKEKYAHKYIELWTRRGHSVLHITCSIGDLLMPKTGAEVTAARIKDHIASLRNGRVLVHGLSVGGYITQHVLKDDDPSVTPKLSHQIYDSFTNVEGLADGVENAVPSRYSGIARKIGDMYLKYADLSSFNQARNFILEGKANSPVFFMHSMADRVASFERTRPLIAAMQQKTPVDLFLVPKEEGIPHVALLRKMGPPSYMEIIETFLDYHRDPVE